MPHGEHQRLYPAALDQVEIVVALSTGVEALVLEEVHEPWPGRVSVEAGSQTLPEMVTRQFGTFRFGMTLKLKNEMQL